MHAIVANQPRKTKPIAASARDEIAREFRFAGTRRSADQHRARADQNGGSMDRRLQRH
jgi:hypothetical protein